MKRWLVSSLTLLTTSGCFTTRYLLQAASGQYELLHQARSLSVVQDDASVPPRVKALLAKVPAIKRFGQLNGLTPTGNYAQYADLHRSAAVWVVQGCAPLSFSPRRWSFPIVGTVPYLGFFDEAAARAYAATLAAEEHLDVTVRTASAYSTLGWFKDPVLSTMLSDGPEAFSDLANTILHESVHATVYVPDQSSFNESLASVVADELTFRLVVGRSGLDGPETKAFFSGEARSALVVAELHRAFDDLDAVYRSPRSDDEKRQLKAERLADLQRRLGTRRTFNNADLAGYRTYDTARPALERLRRACGPLPRLLDAVRTLSPKDFTSPQQTAFDELVERLAAQQCRATEKTTQ